MRRMIVLAVFSVILLAGCATGSAGISAGTKTPAPPSTTSADLEAVVDDCRQAAIDDVLFGFEGSGGSGATTPAEVFDMNYGVDNAQVEPAEGGWEVTFTDTGNHDPGAVSILCSWVDGDATARTE